MYITTYYVFVVAYCVQVNESEDSNVISKNVLWYCGGAVLKRVSLSSSVKESESESQREDAERPRREEREDAQKE